MDRHIISTKLNQTILLLIIQLSFNFNHEAKRRSHLPQHVHSLHEGISYSFQYCYFKAKWECSLFQHVQSKHESVTYSCEQWDHKDKQKEIFSDISNLCMKELLKVVRNVTIRLNKK